MNNNLSITNGHDINSVSELYNKLQKAIVEVQANKKQYDAAYRSIILLKKNYQAEMNRLLSLLRNNAAQVEKISREN